MNLGRISGEAIAAYHGSEAISHSRLEIFRRRPALYYKRFIAKSVPPPESESFAIGSALHALTLEGPDAYAERFATRPEGIDRRTNAGKAAWEKFCAENAGKAVLTQDDADLVVNMHASIHGNETARMLLTGGEAEVTWRASSKSLPLPLQGRTDYFNGAGCALSEGRPYVADLKSVDSLDGEEFRNFARAFVNFGYHRQCGFYLPLLQDCGVRCWDFFFIVVEKREPFGSVVYKPTEDAVSCGIDETVNDLRSLAQCYSRNEWPNMPAGVQEIALPAWYRAKEAA